MSDSSRWTAVRILLLTGRFVLGGIFIAAAYYKLEPRIPAMPWSSAAVKTSLAMFAMQVDSYQMLSWEHANFVAHTLPFFELLIGLWLISGVWLQIPSLLTTLMLGGFLTAMIRAYVLGLEINCGCFGPGERVGPMSFLRDGLFFVLSLAVTIGAFLAARRKSAPESHAASTSPLEQAR
jgi:putative oxidoreductase